MERLVRVSEGGEEEGVANNYQTSQMPNMPSKRIVVIYKECLRNHAAAMGVSATDGCGEFMPGGGDDDPTLDPLVCSACTCHRNFHKKIELELPDHHHHHYFDQITNNNNLIINHSSAGINNNIVPLNSCYVGGNPVFSETDEMEGNSGGGSAKKRFRTKFSSDQKEKMLEFAESVGWKMQKQEEASAQRLCQEIGVKRRVLKVWMHNNKNSLAKNNTKRVVDDDDHGHIN